MTEAVFLAFYAILNPGDEVLIPDNAYGPGKELARNELAGWGITHRFYDPMDPASLAQAVGALQAIDHTEHPKARLVARPDEGRGARYPG